MFQSNYYKFVLIQILIAFTFFNMAFGGGPAAPANLDVAAGPNDLGPCFANGAYLPSAMSCANEGELATDPDTPTEPLCSTAPTGRFNLVELSTVSGQLPRLSGTALANTRNSNCAVPNQLVFAARCLRSCKLCCKHPDYDSCKDIITTGCDFSLCNNMAYALTQCPSTCGKCREVIAQNKETELCADLDGDCTAKKIMDQCKDQAVQKRCALTCNDKSNDKLCKDFTNDARRLLATTLPPVVPPNIPSGTNAPVAGGDKAMNCKDNLALCNNPVYRDFMQENCQETCKGSSTGGGGTAGCTDRPHTNCVVWKMNGFCENDFYTEAQKRDFCGATCKLC